MPRALTVMWFRQDLRLRDNPALLAACAAGSVLPVYILDDHHAGDWAMGAASRWWLHHSLTELDKSLTKKLWVLQGDPLKLLPTLMQEQGATHIVWNRCYEPWRIQRDKKLKQALTGSGFEVASYNGSLLWEPWTNLKADQTPYKVFTPFYKNARAKLPPPELPEPAPKPLSLANCDQPAGKIDALELLPGIHWYGGMAECWQPGEKGAGDKLSQFLNHGMQNYKSGRDFPASQSVSRLSPHLHYGEISPRQVWHAAQAESGDTRLESQIEHYQRELAWREFSYSLLYPFPNLTEQNMNPRFDAFPWRRDDELLKAWQQGTTGYPLVDAGMRELWQTGYMHNRVRMVVGSFLVKNLMHHWRDGARWFWDCLLDADLPNNTCSWQWVAGCGADAAPYFRIFNPVTQSSKFDPEGDYIKRFVPELAKLPARYLHDPHSAPANVLEAAGVKLGETYPEPIVDLKQSREAALDAYQQIKAS